MRGEPGGRAAMMAVGSRVKRPRGARNCRPMRTLRGGEGNFPPRKPLKRPETRK